MRGLIFLLLLRSAAAARRESASWAARVDAADAVAVAAALQRGEPFVATGALDAEQCARWTEEFVAVVGECECDAQCRDVEWGVSLERTTVVGFLRSALESSHAAPRFLFDEELLGDDAARELRDLALEPARAAVFAGERSWLELFPRNARPLECCVVGAGAGARSPLHRDPFDWTGTSVCIEGSKVWRFALPRSQCADLDAVFAAFELPSAAFGAPISAGTQSAIDLFAARRPDAHDEPWPEPWDYGDCDLELLQRWAHPDRFCASSDVDESAVRFVTALQRAGDVVVVPPRSWHQTYALEPSLALASQHCGERDAHAVFAHILRHSRATNPAQVLRGLEEPAEPRAHVARLFEHLRTHSEVELV